MELKDRMLLYRAKHKLSQEQMDKLLEATKGTTTRIERGHVPNKMNKLRFELKMSELEKESY